VLDEVAKPYKIIEIKKNLSAMQEVVRKSEEVDETPTYELQCDSSIIHIGLHKKDDQLFVALSLGDDKIHLFEASSDSYYSKRLQKSEILALGTVRGFFEEFNERKN
jgi:6-phosphogluconolactonase (cycloisomerase 2 family)